jgi:hypothetical protein
MPDAVLALVAAGCWVIAAVKFRAYISSRGASVTLREYFLSLVSLAAIGTLMISAVMTRVDHISANLSVLLSGAAGIAYATAGRTSLEASSSPSVSARRAVARWWIAGLSMILAYSFFFLISPPRFHEVEIPDFAITYTQDKALAASNLVRLTWYAIISAHFYRRFLVYARKESSRPTRWGFWLHSRVGLLGLAYVSYELAYVVARVTGHPLPGTEITTGNTIISGLILLLLAATLMLYTGPAVETWLRFTSLAPLWQTVAAHRHGAVLDDASFALPERLIRRRQENVDGLARLMPYHDPGTWRHAYERAREAGLTTAAAETIADAVAILHALGQENAGKKPPQLNSSPRWGQQDEIKWQQRVGRALRMPLVKALADEQTAGRTKVAVS